MSKTAKVRLFPPGWPTLRGGSAFALLVLGKGRALSGHQKTVTLVVEQNRQEEWQRVGIIDLDDQAAELLMREAQQKQSIVS